MVHLACKKEEKLFVPLLFLFPLHLSVKRSYFTKFMQFVFGLPLTIPPAKKNSICKLILLYFFCVMIDGKFFMLSKVESLYR